jgi:hypothetical protein
MAGTKLEAIRANGIALECGGMKRRAEEEFKDFSWHYALISIAITGLRAPSSNSSATPGCDRRRMTDDIGKHYAV